MKDEWDRIRQPIESALSPKLAAYEKRSFEHLGLSFGD
jgi:hypothetical protein